MGKICYLFFSFLITSVLSDVFPKNENKVYDRELDFDDSQLVIVIGETERDAKGVFFWFTSVGLDEEEDKLIFGLEAFPNARGYPQYLAKWYFNSEYNEEESYSHDFGVGNFELTFNFSFGACQVTDNQGYSFFNRAVDNDLITNLEIWDADEKGEKVKIQKVIMIPSDSNYIDDDD